MCPKKSQDNAILGPFPIGSSNIYHQYTPVMLAYIYIPAPWIRHGFHHHHHPMIFPSPTGSKRLRLFPGGRPLPRSRWTSAWTPQLVPVVRLLAAGGGGGAQVGWRCGALDDGWGMFRGDIFMVIRYDIVYIYIYIILIYIVIYIHIY